MNDNVVAIKFSPTVLLRTPALQYTNKMFRNNILFFVIIIDWFVKYLFIIFVVALFKNMYYVMYIIIFSERKNIRNCTIYI